MSTQPADLVWKDATFIALDLETSGKYPLDADICEIAAVKWKNGQIIDEFHTLVKPRLPMDDFVISIHNITNEMVENAPPIKDVIHKLHAFIQDGFILAHHAPFDIGFLAVEFEKARLPLPTLPVFCTCLLARRLFPESENHRLVTLVNLLGLDGGAAHRALDDAKACLQLGIKNFERAGESARITEIFEHQGGDIPWQQFSINDLRANPVLGRVVEALEKKSDLQITYAGGSRPNIPRTVKPIGLVRSLDDDFLVAVDEPGAVPKRYFLHRITGAVL